MGWVCPFGPEGTAGIGPDFFGPDGIGCDAIGCDAFGLDAFGFKGLKGMDLIGIICGDTVYNTYTMILILASSNMAIMNPCNHVYD